MLSDYDEEEIDEVHAVITVPAYFSTSQRKATSDAAELAGIKVLKLISEPTAAALFYFHNTDIKSNRVMILDLGGGTFDISIIEKDNENMNVLCVDGDSYLGGRDFDENLVAYFKKSLGGTNWSQRLTRRLRVAAKNIKEVLSTTNECTETLYHFYEHNKHQTFSITRDEFNEINKHLFEKTIAIVKNCLCKNKLTTDDLDHVILVGGSTRIPKIRELLGQLFGAEKLILYLNPDEAVAAGASIEAYRLSRSKDELLEEATDKLQSIKIKDVIPFDLGVRIFFDLFVPNILMNTPLPINKTCILYSSSNDQPQAEIDIFEGKWKYAHANHFLDKVQIQQMPEGEVGKTEVHLNYSIDENGILTIKAAVKNTDKVESKEIPLNSERLNVKSVTKWNEDLDREFERKALLQNCSYYLCSKYIYSDSGNEDEFYRDWCAEILDYVENAKNSKELSDELHNFLDEFPDRSSKYINLLRRVLESSETSLELLREMWFNRKKYFT